MRGRAERLFFLQLAMTLAGCVCTPCLQCLRPARLRLASGIALDKICHVDDHFLFLQQKAFLGYRIQQTGVKLSTTNLGSIRSSASPSISGVSGL